jgi:hypothetical protein
MAAECRALVDMADLVVAAVLEALARMADLQRQRTISAQVRTRVRIRRAVEMEATAFSHRSPVQLNGTAAVAAEASTPTEVQQLLEAKVARAVVQMVPGVQTATALAQRTVLAVAAVAAMLKHVAETEEMVWSSFRMYNLLSLQQLQQPPQRFALQLRLQHPRLKLW